MGSVTGRGRRELIATNVCLKNRRLVDVRGVIVLGVAGITEPVEITPANLIFLPVCEPPEIRSLRKSERFRNLQLACRGAGG